MGFFGCFFLYTYISTYKLYVLKKKSLNIKMWHLQGAKIIRNNQRRCPNDVTEEEKNKYNTTRISTAIVKKKKINAHFNQHCVFTFLELQ